MEIIVNFGGCSDCNALNSRLRGEKNRNFELRSIWALFKVPFKDGWWGWEEAFGRTTSHKSNLQYFSAAANFSRKLFGALDLQFFFLFFFFCLKHFD